MAALIPGFEYDIFISYRHNDKVWVADFIARLESELVTVLGSERALRIYYDSDLKDGLGDAHQVKVSIDHCLLSSVILMPLISLTYCEPERYSWKYEFLPFLEHAKSDHLGDRLGETYTLNLFTIESDSAELYQPTTAAQTVVNLLLETARLARAENLPIYIVCTMRSDFVRQCAEFQGLIEQVGASQYFVPRLLRHEFLGVIKEPAELSGNRISERLVQRLLYDIGQDQLPVLQHALRRIWLAADEGREEMDLIHYAMVGGLSDELPPEDQARFAAWRAALPAHQQKFLLEKPGLRNVLDAHANQLYFEANDLYNRDFQPPLPPGTAERATEQTFRVLMRTDGKRVVRNRVTGAQITAMLDDAALPWPVVCHILRPFRAEGTTFLAPFPTENEDDRAVLPPDAVLDISHESLIRNWTLLAEWARKEADDVHLVNACRKLGLLGESAWVPTTIRVSEQAMLTNNRAKDPQDRMNAFLWEYLLANKAGRVLDKNDAADVAASVFNLCFWRPLSDKPDSISLIAPSLIYQLSGEGLNTGLNAPFKAGGLADKVHLARQRLENSPFTVGSSRLKHISYILLGYAHLKTRQTVGGWREYDKAELIAPADYQGPALLQS